MAQLAAPWLDNQSRLGKWESNHHKRTAKDEKLLRWCYDRYKSWWVSLLTKNLKLATYTCLTSPELSPLTAHQVQISFDFLFSD